LRIRKKPSGKTPSELNKETVVVMNNCKVPKLARMLKSDDQAMESSRDTHGKGACNN